jgi:iron only hydrogenase large subunit-like protein
MEKGIDHDEDFFAFANMTFTNCTNFLDERDHSSMSEGAPFRKTCCPTCIEDIAKVFPGIDVHFWRGRWIFGD